MKKTAWFIPSLLMGSGGHRTILQNASFLASKGEFQCDIYVEDDASVKNSAELQKVAEKYFGECPGCRFILGYTLEDTYDLYFATAWYTAKIVRDIPTDAPKLYFVQDFEALFNPMGDGYLLACTSYCYGLKPITIGRWLTNKMCTEYGAQSQYFDFCADKATYMPLPETQKENAICFIYQPEKPRRCSTIGIEALGIIKHLRPDVKIYLYGSREKGNVWFEHTNLGIISTEQCNELYNRCKVGLCISSSNPSRIPFEMMSSGLPVVDIYMENNLYDMPDSAISLAHYTPESIAQAVIDILDSPRRQAQMSEAGKAFMKVKSLEYGFEQFYQAVLNILSDSIPEVEPNQKTYLQGPVIADVIKPMQSVSFSGGYVPHATGFIGKLKQNRWIKKNRFLRRCWRALKQIFK